MTLIHTHIIDCNTFEFFVEMGPLFHKVKVKQTTSFAGTELEPDFPNGSVSTWNATAALYCKTPEECVNAVARKILAEWTNI